MEATSVRRLEGAVVSENMQRSSTFSSANTTYEFPSMMSLETLTEAVTLSLA